jgi:hypothetical protein
MRKLVFITALLLCAGFVFGQTVHKGVVLGLHHMNIILKEDVSMNDYIGFFENTMKPAIEESLKGVKVFMLTGDRGENTNGYGLLYVVDSKELRDKYWPEEGSPSKELQELNQKMMTELQKYIVSMSSEYTDWIVR